MYTNFVFIVKQADKCSSVSRLCSTKSPSWRAIDSLEQDKKAPKGLCTYRCILVFFVATCIISLAYQSSEIALMHVYVSFSKYKVAKFYINEFPRRQYIWKENLRTKSANEKNFAHKQGLVVKFASSDVITHKGHCLSCFLLYVTSAPCWTAD